MAEDPGITLRRKWTALALGTLIGLLAYWMALLSLAAPVEEAGEVPEATGALALAMLLVPVAYFAVASVSERPHRWWGTLAATATGVVAGTVTALAARDLASAVVAGLAMGGAVALRPDRRGWLARRGLAVLVVAVYTVVIVRVTPLLAILMAPLLPFLAVGVADMIAERSTERRRPARGTG